VATAPERDVGCTQREADAGSFGDVAGVGDKAVGDVDAAGGVRGDDVGEWQAGQLRESSVAGDQEVSGFGGERTKLVGGGLQAEPAVADRTGDPDVVARLRAGATDGPARADLSEQGQRQGERAIGGGGVAADEAVANAPDPCPARVRRLRAGRAGGSSARSGRGAPHPVFRPWR